MSSIVSVIIVTYNSSKYIEEALDSVATQTWTDLELIISDDCSEDSTLDICSEWLKRNEKRFISTQLITSPNNTGITANSNRGLAAAKGDWIKFCAGDDALLPNCIEDNMQFVFERENIMALFSYCRVYLETTIEDHFLKIYPSSYPSNIISDELSASDQYKLLLTSNRIPFTPSFFFHRNTILMNGQIDDRFPYSEDYLRWLNLTKNGIKLHFMDKETMKYRIHGCSTSKSLEELIVNPVYYKTESSIKLYAYPYLPWDLRLSKTHIWYARQLFRIKFFNRKNTLNACLHYSLTKLLNPFHWVIYFKSTYCSKYKRDLFYK